MGWLVTVFTAALLFLLMLGGCAGAKARYDGAVSPIVENYNTLLMEINVDGHHKTGFGQVGWSYANGERPHGQITIHTPLPGTINLVGHLCGIDRRDYHPNKGGSFRYDIAELFEDFSDDITYCKVNVHVQWELPKGMTSEYPLEGMIGKIHFRFREEGKRAVAMTWTPGVSGDNEMQGMGAAQFRAFNPDLTQPVTEPIRLRMSVPEPLTEGTVRLFGCGHGIESMPFSGTDIVISRETILGPAPVKGSCTLFGFIVGKNAAGEVVRYDAAVGAEIYGQNVMYLSGTVSVRDDGQICYAGEDAMSVAILNYGNTNDASFDLEHCFKAVPGGNARLGMFTVKGRAVFFKITGSQIETWQ